MGNLGVQVSVRSSVHPFVHPSTFALGVLWAQLLVQFCTSRFIFVTFSTLWTWSFSDHSGYLVRAIPHTFLYRSFWNFAHVFSMVLRCACGLDIILELSFVTFCRTCFSMGDLGVQVSVRSSVGPFVHPSTFALGVLWVQLLVQFCTNRFTFVTFSTLWTWSFRSVCLSIRSSIRQHLPWMSCEYNSCYSFLPIFLKLCRCFLHRLRMCMWFGYNCWIIFYHFFHFVNLVIFRPLCIDSGYLVSATAHTILYRSFWNFAHVFCMVWRCACGLDIIIALIFVTFSTLWTLSFSDLRFYESL